VSRYRERVRERQVLHLGRGRLAKRGGKQCFKQAGNQRELVRPREPGSLACNMTAFSLAGRNRDTGREGQADMQ
jgi:hypothetical protein